MWHSFFWRTRGIFEFICMTYSWTLYSFVICCCRVSLHVDGLRVFCLALAPYLQHTRHLLVIHLVLLATFSMAVCGTCRGPLQYHGCCTVAVTDTQVWYLITGIASYFTVSDNIYVVYSLINICVQSLTLLIGQEWYVAPKKIQFRTLGTAEWKFRVEILTHGTSKISTQRP